MDQTRQHVPQGRFLGGRFAQGHRRRGVERWQELDYIDSWGGREDATDDYVFGDGLEVLKFGTRGSSLREGRVCLEGSFGDTKSSVPRFVADNHWTAPTHDGLYVEFQRIGRAIPLQGFSHRCNHEKSKKNLNDEARRIHMYSLTNSWTSECEPRYPSYLQNPNEPIRRSRRLNPRPLQ